MPNEDRLLEAVLRILDHAECHEIVRSSGSYDTGPLCTTCGAKVRTLLHRTLVQGEPLPGVVAGMAAGEETEAALAQPERVTALPEPFSPQEHWEPVAAHDVFAADEPDVPGAPGPVTLHLPRASGAAGTWILPLREDVGAAAWAPVGEAEPDWAPEPIPEPAEAWPEPAEAEPARKAEPMEWPTLAEEPEPARETASEVWPPEPIPEIEPIPEDTFTLEPEEEVEFEAAPVEDEAEFEEVGFEAVEAEPASDTAWPEQGYTHAEPGAAPVHAYHAGEYALYAVNSPGGETQYVFSREALAGGQPVAALPAGSRVRTTPMGVPVLEWEGEELLRSLGVPAAYAETLARHGVRDLESLLDADPAKLSAQAGVPAHRLKRARSAAWLVARAGLSTPDAVLMSQTDLTPEELAGASLKDVSRRLETQGARLSESRLRDLLDAVVTASGKP